MLRWLIIMTISLSIMGCAHQRPTSFETPLTTIWIADEQRTSTIPIPEKLPCFKLHQAEISHLKKLLADKDKSIQIYQTRQQDLTQVLSEAMREINRAQAKLHRLATQPGTASKIAEVEVMLKSLEQSQLPESDQRLVMQAQRLLNAATTAYERNDFANAMNHAAQSQAFIEMIAHPNRKLSNSQQTAVSLRIPILLRTINDSNLYMKPNDQAIVLDTLNKHTLLSANAYHGNWLRVQTGKGLLGWILNTQVESGVESHLRH